MVLKSHPVSDPVSVVSSSAVQQEFIMVLNIEVHVNSYEDPNPELIVAALW